MAPRPSAEKPSMKVSLSRQSGLRAEASGHFGILATALVVIFLAIIAFGLPS
jgi:hypothetical protein